MLQHFNIARFQLTEDYGSCTLRKDPVIAAFVDQFKTADFWKSSPNYLLQIALPFHFCSLSPNMRLWTGCSAKGADLCSFRRTVYNSYFEKVFLINFISTYSLWLQHFIFVRLLLIEDYEQGALRKELIIATLIEGFQIATLRKFY